MKTIIRTFKLSTGEEASVMTFEDLFNHGAQRFLRKHLAWATNNGHGVQIVSEKDDKLYGV